MPNPGIPREVAEARLQAIEAKLREGFVPKGCPTKAGECGAVAAAAMDDGYSRSSSETWYRAAVKYAERDADWSQYVPRVEPVLSAPPGYRVKGTSTLVDPSGNVKAQWIKTDADREAQQALFEEAARRMADRIPRARPVKAPSKGNSALCNLYTVTDYHMGMLAWHREGGADWDISIAKRLLTDAFAHMIAASPDAETAVVCQLGDFLHSDGLLPLTPTSGHVLDVDGRFSKIVEATIHSLRAVVDMALSKHDRVHLIMAEGNHDLASSVWLRKMFAAMYENEPRLEVNDSELPYYAFRHGKTMLGFHHGHIRKPDELPGFFAAQFPDIWGQTTKRYVHSGHRHHKYENEKNGMEIVQHPTLAARDAHAARNGWFAERRAMSITYHSEYGETGRNMVTPEMLA